MNGGRSADELARVFRKAADANRAALGMARELANGLGVRNFARYEIGDDEQLDVDELVAWVEIARSQAPGQGLVLNALPADTRTDPQSPPLGAGREEASNGHREEAHR
jgi:hypothetical protein